MDVRYVSIAFGLVRFAAGLRGFLREPISVHAARAIVERRMQTRDQAFLDLVARVLDNPRSPYLQLFRAAGCERGDVGDLVRRGGVEHALRALRDAGVYIRFEEFKGRAAVVRGGQVFRFQPADFDNPFVRPHYVTSSGGTRGRPVRILLDLDHLAHTAPSWALWFAAHDWLSAPLVLVTPPSPGIVNRQLRCLKFGRHFVKWFSTGGGGSPAYRLTSAYLHILVRLMAGMPRAEAVPLAEIGRVAEHLARMRQAGESPCVVTSPSTATRICLDARERGQSLAGVSFLLGGEPFTEARRRLIESVGAKGVPTYGFSEVGPVGAQCPTPGVADDVHVHLDGGAVIERRRAVAPDQEVNALLVTSFRPTAPKVLLNVEIGDTGRLESRQCGCFFDELGFHQHLHTIRSFEKLTGEGTTFLGSDVALVLEEVLPARFGGTLTDYQLVEMQDGRGLSEYRLCVSPELGPLDEPAVLATFLDALSRLRPPYRFMAQQWAESLHVERRRPVETARGKVPAFRTLEAGDAAVASRGDDAFRR